MIRRTTFAFLSWFFPTVLLAQVDAQKIREIDLFVTQNFELQNYPSLCIAVIEKGEVKYIKAFGYADQKLKKKATTQTIYQIGSVTKVFTGNILSRLLVENKIGLTSPVSTFFPGPVVFPKDSTGRGLTVFDVATHTGGLPTYPPTLHRLNGDAPILGFPKDSLLAGISQTRLLFNIGRRWRYSNYGYGVLGNIIEAVEKKPLDDVFASRLFRPLKMSSTSLLYRPEYKKRLAVPYLVDELRIENKPWNLESIAACGNVYSTITDMSKAMIYFLGSSPEVKLQTTKQYQIVDTSSYGLGCFVNRPRSYETYYINHGGDLDGYGSWFTFFPEKEIGFVLLTNSKKGREFSDLGYALGDIIMGKNVTLPAPTVLSLMRKTYMESGVEGSLGAYLKNKTIKTYSYDENALNLFGYDLLGLNKNKDAIKVFTLCTEEYPNSANAFDSLAEAYYTDGDPKESLKNYQRSIELNPDNRNAADWIKKIRGN